MEYRNDPTAGQERIGRIVGGLAGTQCEQPARKLGVDVAMESLVESIDVLNKELAHLEHRLSPICKQAPCDVVKEPGVASSCSESMIGSMIQSQADRIYRLRVGVSRQIELLEI